MFLKKKENVNVMTCAKKKKDEMKNPKHVMLFFPLLKVNGGLTFRTCYDLGAMASKVRRHDSRVHPYQRIVTPDRGQFRNPCPHTATLTHCNVTHMPGCLR